MTTRSTFGIGASDIAAIAGQSKYASPWDVYLRLTEGGSVDETALEDRDLHKRTGWGHRLEPVIRQAYADETGLEVVVPGSMFSRERPWARATPDGVALGERRRGDPDPASVNQDNVPLFLGGQDRLVQCKNVGQFVAREWAEAPPDYVVLQEQWELYVSGLSRADVAALIGGGDFRVFTVWRDEAMIADLATIAEDFWRRVQERRPPDVDGSDACRAQIAGRLASAKATELVADVRLEQIAMRYQEHYLLEEAAEAGKRIAVNEILDALATAGATKLVTKERGTITTRRTPEKVVETVDWKAVVLRLSDHPAVTELCRALVAEHTTKTHKPAGISLVAPRDWKKGNAE